MQFLRNIIMFLLGSSLGFALLFAMVALLEATQFFRGW